MKWLINTALVFLLLFGAAARAADPADTAFLQEEPYRKQKQQVDLSSVKSAQDMAVIRHAINPVMRFFIGLNFPELPPAVDRELLTGHGRQVLQRPPMRSKYNRYLGHRFSHWQVCGDQLSVHAVFTDLLRKDFWQADFLFVRDGHSWRFEDHRPAQC